MHQTTCLVVLALSLLAAPAGAQWSNAADPVADPLAERLPPVSPAFTEVTAGSGVLFWHTDKGDAMAGGVCLFDYDNDGFPDLYATARGFTTNRLYRNQQDGTFVDVTAASGLGTVGESMGAYAADLDNDGWQDLLVLIEGDVRLFANQGGTFADVTTQSGVVNDAWAAAATFGDFDRDGLLDFYVGNYVLSGSFPLWTGSPNRLFRNLGGLRFQDVTGTAGVDGSIGNTLSSLFFDCDRDGWVDLLVGNDFGPFVVPNQLFHNNHDGTFTEVGASAGFDIAEFNMGLATADVNGDLMPDVYTTNLGGNHLLLNDGAGNFVDVATRWNATEGRSRGMLLTSWACMFLDMDLDGRRDLYVSNGWIGAVWWLTNDPLAPSHLLHNTGNRFSVLTGSSSIQDPRVGRGAACADLDGDGDEDLVQLNNSSLLRIYRNDTRTRNRALILDLVGTTSNRDGIGAQLVVRAGARMQAMDYTRGGSYASCNGSTIILGLGRASVADEVTVVWPSGVTSHHFGLAAGVRHTLVEP